MQKRKNHKNCKNTKLSKCKTSLAPHLSLGSGAEHCRRQLRSAPGPKAPEACLVALLRFSTLYSPFCTLPQYFTSKMLTPFVFFSKMLEFLSSNSKMFLKSRLNLPHFQRKIQLDLFRPLGHDIDPMGAFFFRRGGV